VLTDWVIELFFPRDIVQTIDLSEPRRDTEIQVMEHLVRPAAVPS
jgi:hypothetical protein